MKRLFLFIITSSIIHGATAQSAKRLSLMNGYKAENNVIDTARSYYTEYNYANGTAVNPSENTSYFRANTSVPFNPNLKTLYSYRTDGRIAEELELLWNNGQWQNYRKYIHNYEQSSDRYTGYGTFTWYANNWYEFNRIIYGYNNDGIMAYITEMDTVNALLTYITGYDTMYDASGRKSEYRIRKYINNNWWTKEYYEYKYTGNNTRADSIIYWFSNDPTVNSPVPNRIYYYSYNIAGQATQVRERLVTSSIIHNIKTYTYEPTFGLLAQEEDAYWDGNSNSHVTNRVSTWTYDAQKRITNETQERLANNSLIKEREFQYSYAPDSSIVSVVYGQLDYNTQIYSLANKTDYIFETVNLTDVNEIQKSLPAKAFPNPFIYNTIIEFESPESGEVQVQITDLNGRVVYQQKVFTVNGNNRFLWDATDNQAHALPGGMYVVQLNGNSFNQTFKLVKQ